MKRRKNNKTREQSWLLLLLLFLIGLFVVSYRSFANGNTSQPETPPRVEPPEPQPMIASIGGGGGSSPEPANNEFLTNEFLTTEFA